MFDSGFQNLSFLFDCIRGYTRQTVCPDCNMPDVRLLDRKFIVARLFECQTCLLRFRHPVEDPARMRSFYQHTYTQEDGITTQLPTKHAWEAMVRSGFGEKDISHYVSLLRTIFPSRVPSDIRMLDYGCSWGYQTWQFRAAGFDCTGFEISTPRAMYGRKILGLPIHNDLMEISSGFDIFFSSHVIEHVPSPRKLLEEAFDLLNPGGYMIIESPNGSDEFRRQRPEHFHKLWGRVHPFMLSPSFYTHWLAGRPAFYTSWPFGDLAERYLAWNQYQTMIDRLDGPSLLMITRKN